MIGHIKGRWVIFPCSQNSTCAGKVKKYDDQAKIVTVSTNTGEQWTVPLASIEFMSTKGVKHNKAVSAFGRALMRD